MAREANHIIYARLMEHLSYGYFLYSNIGSRSLYPGSIGYFDDNGDWYKLEAISKRNLKASGVHHIPYIESEQGSITMGDAAANAGVPGTPADAQFQLTMQASRKAVAICIPEPITDIHLTNPSTIHSWIKNNAERLILHHNDTINRHGIWAIIKTWKCKQAAKTVLRSHQRSVLGGVKAALQGIGGMQLGAATWSGDSTKACVQHSRIPSDEDVVVSFQGIHITRMWVWGKKDALREEKRPKQLSKAGSIFQHKTIPKGRKPIRQVFNPRTDHAPPGGARTHTIQGSDGRMYQLEYEVWGDVVDPFTVDTEEEKPDQPQPNTINAPKGGEPTYTIMGNDRRPYQMNYELGGSIVDSMTLNEKVPSASLHKVRQQPQSSGSSPWTWSSEHSRYYRLEYSKTGEPKYIWA